MMIMWLALYRFLIYWPFWCFGLWAWNKRTLWQRQSRPSVRTSTAAKWSWKRLQKRSLWVTVKVAPVAARLPISPPKTEPNLALTDWQAFWKRQINWPLPLPVHPLLPHPHRCSTAIVQQILLRLHRQPKICQTWLQQRAPNKHWLHHCSEHLFYRLHLSHQT